MADPKLRCGRCGAEVARLTDGGLVGYDVRHTRRRRADEHSNAFGRVYVDLDDWDGVPPDAAPGGGRVTSNELTADRLDAQCSGRCGQRYPVAVIVAEGRKLRRTGRGSAKLPT